MRLCPRQSWADAEGVGLASRLKSLGGAPCAASADRGAPMPRCPRPARASGPQPGGGSRHAAGSAGHRRRLQAALSPSKSAGGWGPRRLRAAQHGPPVNQLRHGTTAATPPSGDRRPCCQAYRRRSRTRHAVVEQPPGHLLPLFSPSFSRLCGPSGLQSPCGKERLDRKAQLCPEGGSRASPQPRQSPMSPSPRHATHPRGR